MITEKDKKQIANWSQTLEGDIRIHLILTEDDRSQAFKEFCDDLTRIVPKISIKTRKGRRIGTACHTDRKC